MPKIILAEDDPMISDIYKKKFELEGFDFRIASTGKEVIRKLKEEGCDLLLLDLILPEMTGMEVLKKIREDNEIAKTNVAIFSNLGEEEYFEEAKKLGAVAFITKSAHTPSEAVAAIKGILEKLGVEK